MKNLHAINRHLRNSLIRDETLLEIAEWVKDTCLLFETSVPLTYRVASMFVDGLAREVSISERSAK